MVLKKISGSPPLIIWRYLMYPIRIQLALLHLSLNTFAILLQAGLEPLDLLFQTKEK